MEAIAENAATQYRASWIARHPIVAFLLAPVPLVVTAWLVYLAIGAVVFLVILPAVSSTLALEGKPVDEWVPGVMWFALAFHVGLKFVPPVIVAVVACYLVHRSGQNWRWALVACSVVGIVAGLFSSTLELPIEAGSGRLSVGFGLPPGIDQVGQCLLPLLVGWFLIWRYRHLWRAAGAAPANTA